MAIRLVHQNGETKGSFLQGPDNLQSCNKYERIEIGSPHSTLETCIKTTLSLFREKRIEVLYNVQKGLFARIFVVSGSITSRQDPLPLTGIPKEIAQEKNIQRIKQFFEATHLIPEKGVDGSYNRVSVHVSGEGGVKAKIPFQPGLALGSIVKGETLDNMDTYAHVIAQREAIETQVEAAEQRITMLNMKIEAKEREKGEKKTEMQNANQRLVQCWQAEVRSLTKSIEVLSEKLTHLMEDVDIPFFENFSSGIESPIDMGSSIIDVQPRSFDSLNFNSQYINMKQNLESIHDQAKHSSQATSVSASGGFWVFQASASHSWSSASSERLAQIKKEDKAEGVLMINSVVTTRHVRSFTDIRFEKRKLKMLLDVMENGKEQDLKKFGITVIDGQKMIFVLTEAVLGGAFTALVTFLDEQKMNRDIEKRAQEQGSHTSANVGVGGVLWNASIGVSHSQMSGSQAEDDILRSLTTTKVNIEIFSQGAIPTFARGVIEHEIIKHLDLNPSKFELSQKDEAEAKNMASLKNDERATAVNKRRMKLENAQVAVLNTYRGLTSSKEKQTLHTPSSVLEAYDSFSTNITTDSDCGVPIGFNYQVFSQEQLREIFNEMENTEKK